MIYKFGICTYRDIGYQTFVCVSDDINGNNDPNMFNVFKKEVLDYLRIELQVNILRLSKIIYDTNHYIITLDNIKFYLSVCPTIKSGDLYYVPCNILRFLQSRPFNHEKVYINEYDETTIIENAKRPIEYIKANTVNISYDYYWQYTVCPDIFIRILECCLYRNMSLTDHTLECLNNNNIVYTPDTIHRTIISELFERDKTRFLTILEKYPILLNVLTKVYGVKVNIIFEEFLPKKSSYKLGYNTLNGKIVEEKNQKNPYLINKDVKEEVNEISEKRGLYSMYKMPTSSEINLKEEDIYKLAEDRRKLAEDRLSSLKNINKVPR